MKTIAIYLALISSNFNVQLDAKETKCLATAIHSEASGEPVLAKADVAYAINNRRVGSYYPDTFCGVVYQKEQFPNIEKRVIDYNSKSWKQSVEVAAYAQVGLIKDRTQGATVYYAYNLIDFPKSWDRDALILVGDLYNHRFYIEKRLFKEMKIAYGYN